MQQSPLLEQVGIYTYVALYIYDSGVVSITVEPVMADTIPTSCILHFLILVHMYRHKVGIVYVTTLVPIDTHCSSVVTLRGNNRCNVANVNEM